jgi:hypothetical protein
VVSFAHFIIKTEFGIEHAGREIFERTLEEIIAGDRFRGSGRNVSAWINHAGWDSVILTRT